MPLALPRFALLAFLVTALGTTLAFPPFFGCGKTPFIFFRPPTAQPAPVAFVHAEKKVALSAGLSAAAWNHCVIPWAVTHPRLFIFPDLPGPLIFLQSGDTRQDRRQEHDFFEKFPDKNKLGVAFLLRVPALALRSYTVPPDSRNAPGKGPLAPRADPAGFPEKRKGQAFSRNTPIGV